MKENIWKWQLCDICGAKPYTFIIFPGMKQNSEKSRQYKKMMTVMIIITNQMKMGVICQPQQSTTEKIIEGNLINAWRIVLR